MSFFLKSRKRKQGFKAPKIKNGNATGKKKNKASALTEEVESESDVDSSEFTETRDKLYSSEEEEETAQQKRLRLAKEYLSKIEAEEAENKDDEESMKDVVSNRLQHDIVGCFVDSITDLVHCTLPQPSASEQAGKLMKQVADLCSCPQDQDLRVFRGHSLPLTAIVISPDDKFVFTASKDCNICKWNVETGVKVKTIKGGRKGTEDLQVGHTDHILCMAISSDGQLLAVGDMTSMIKLWNPDDCSFVHKFRGHRGPVTGVAFRKGTHTLFSCSKDRVVKVWSVDDRAYVETLFGHNSPITGIDSLTRDRAITSGGSDKSVHIWKITEDSQLLFHGHGGSIECVTLINESNFFTGGDDNALCLWSVLKKKPSATVKNAHGQTKKIGEENWITAVAALQYTDLVASGSKDGYVRVWKCSADFRSLSPIFSVPVKGFVNALKFSNNGEFLVAAVGQEHRLGRWWRLKDAKNGWVIIPLRPKSIASTES